MKRGLDRPSGPASRTKRDRSSAGSTSERAAMMTRQDTSCKRDWVVMQLPRTLPDPDAVATSTGLSGERPDVAQRCRSAATLDGSGESPAAAYVLGRALRSRCSVQTHEFVARR